MPITMIGHPAPPPAQNSRHQFRHVGGRIAVGGSSSDLIEDLLKLIAAGKDDADAYRAQIEQQTEVVEVAIVERVFVVPLQLQSDPVLEAIDLVRR